MIILNRSAAAMWLIWLNTVIVWQAFFSNYYYFYEVSLSAQTISKYTRIQMKMDIMQRLREGMRQTCALLGE